MTVSTRSLRLPKVTGDVEILIDGESTRDLYEGEVPEEIMAYAQQVIGNGQARVAVSADVSMKDFGNGVSASVTISLSCNQDDETINNVVNSLGVWTRGYAKQQMEQAYAEYQNMYAQKHPGKSV